MTYLVIERFYPGKVRELYRPLEEKGRQLPPGVRYINSWIDEKIETCYQVMESKSREDLLAWTKRWSDYADFDIIPVITSK